jgi:hypothetical protein
MKTLREIESEVIRDRLLRLDWNKAAVAKSLGITVEGLKGKLFKHGILTQSKETSKIKEVKETGYQDPTPQERDEWYNQDRA